jgi:hypothetical protein
MGVLIASKSTISRDQIRVLLARLLVSTIPLIKLTSHIETFSYYPLTSTSTKKPKLNCKLDLGVLY